MNARPKARGGVNSIRLLHSPGPWAAHETETRTAVKSGRRVVAYAQIGAAQDYNAALIAAAPDLLAIAIQIASECGECAGVGVQPDNSPCNDCEFIREAIARATTP